MKCQMTTAGRIGFLVKIYPKVSESFILGEILGLEHYGLPLHIFSLRRPTDRAFSSNTQTVRAPVRYVPPGKVPELIHAFKAHLSLLLQSPRRYASTLAFLIGRKEGNRMREFLKAGCLVRLLRNAGIVHLHAHFASEPAGVAELVKRFAGTSYSISAHAKDIYLSLPESLHRKINDACFTVTCTEYNRRHLTAIAGSEARIYRMYHGVDLDHFSPDAVDTNAATVDTPPLVLSVGRLRAKKGFTVLVEACRRLVDAGCLFRCEIVGYGPERKRLKRLIARLGLATTVKLAGKLNHDALVARYRAATVFALPCQIARDGDRDGIPNVLLEAMAMRLPVVSTNVSGIPEVIEDQETGLLVQPQDPDALADAIGRLLRDADLRARFGNAGQHTLRRMFSHDANLKQVRDLLLEAAHKAAGDSSRATAGERLYAQ
jgi:glycosyltransferase involved in cell wall biosynthesis